jgi:hypothetical protein
MGPRKYLGAVDEIKTSSPTAKQTWTPQTSKPVFLSLCETAAR